MPYITAYIIMELLAATFTPLGKMKKEKDGNQKYIQIIRYVTVGITAIQSVGVAIGLNSLKSASGASAITIDMDLFILSASISMIVGTMLLMWIGEQITQKGIGNGISLIIFCRYCIFYTWCYCRNSWAYKQWSVKLLGSCSIAIYHIGYCWSYYLYRIGREKSSCILL